MKRMEKKIEYFENWRDWAKNLPKNELNKTSMAQINGQQFV